MAHFALAIDDNPDHRSQFIRGARGALQTSGHLEIGAVTRDSFALTWARNATSPWDRHNDPAGAALLLGYAVDDNGEWIDSHRMRNAWHGDTPAAFGGYFVGISWSAERSLAIGTDLLGFFPVYYTQLGSAFVAATSIELLRAHPAFTFREDIEGLAGILLTNGLIDNRALCAGVRRLNQGHVLQYAEGSQPREIEVFRLRHTTASSARTADDARELAHAELLRVIRAHRSRSQRSVLMLSGGLDSRVMAGYLRAENIIETAVCLGRDIDLEVRLGSQIARALGMNVHRERAEPSPADFAEAAVRIARWEQLSCGFSHLEAERSAETLAEIAPTFWSGFALEDVLAAAVRTMALNEKTGEWSCARFFSHLNAWGFPPEALRELLVCKDAPSAIDAQLARLRAIYHCEEDSEPQRAIRAKFATRVRFHVGGVLHRMAFRCWPLLPILDARFLQLQFNVPAELMIGRRLQKDLLNHYYPSLAAIPREHNTFRLESLRPSLLGNVRSVVGGKLRRWYWRWRKDDPRRYVRYYDLNGSLWRAVREAAEPQRAHLNGAMNRAMFDAILPRPETNLVLRDPFSQGTPARLLLGWLLSR